MSIEYVSTICPYCSCGCGINLVVRDGRIIGQEPWKEHPINEGANCPKGKNAYHFLYSNERLKKPLIRKNGVLNETSWDDALDIIASKLKEAASENCGFPIMWSAVVDCAILHRRLLWVQQSVLR
jgi:predicted molibdopterin-dependent oxidoreductase YjgC